jgi:MFS family permease
MYQFDPRNLLRLRGARWSGVPPVVVYLGLTSMFTDISAEMVSSVLPIYLLSVLHLSPLQFGFIDGLSQGASALARLASGLLADRWRRNREVAAAGYALSAVCKLGLLAAGNVWSTLCGIVVLDRIGKGIRTAPRDALISFSSSPQQLGLAFGVHRAFDTLGALLGPLAAFGILALLADAYDVVFVSSFFIALLGLGTLLFFVANPRDEAARVSRFSVSVSAAAALLGGGRFRALVLAGSGLGLFTVADAFIYLRLQRQLALDASVFPLLYVGTALAYLVLAIPVGRIADRIGRGRVFLWGHGLLLLACLSLLIPGTGLITAVLCLALLGGYYACTDGVLMAVASVMVPVPLRASGLALLATATGLARFLASVMFGAIWNWWGMEIALVVFLVGLVAAILLALPALTDRDSILEHGRTISE